MLLHYPATHLHMARFPSQTSTETTHYNRLNTEADMRIQLSSIKLDVKKICRNMKHATVLTNHFFKIMIFHRILFITESVYQFIRESVSYCKFK